MFGWFISADCSRVVVVRTGVHQPEVQAASEPTTTSLECARRGRRKPLLEYEWLQRSARDAHKQRVSGFSSSFTGRSFRCSAWRVLEFWIRVLPLFARRTFFARHTSSSSSVFTIVPTNTCRRAGTNHPPRLCGTHKRIVPQQMTGR